MSHFTWLGRGALELFLKVAEEELVLLLNYNFPFFRGLLAQVGLVNLLGARPPRPLPNLH